MIDVKELQKIMNTGLTAAGNAALFPDGMRIESLERFAPVPDRSRGNFRASSLETLLKYLEEADGDNARVFVGDESVVAVLDFYHSGTVHGWKEDLATYVVEPSSTFRALKSICGTVSQDTIVEYVDDWTPLLSFARAGKEVGATVARGLFANLTIEQVRKSSSETFSFKREKSVTEVLAGGENTPDTMVVRASCIKGLPALDIPCSLGVAEIAGMPAIAVRIIGEKAMEERIKIDFGKAVEEMFNDFVVFHGSYTSSQLEI